MDRKVTSIVSPVRMERRASLLFFYDSLSLRKKVSKFNLKTLIAIAIVYLSFAIARV